MSLIKIGNLILNTDAIESIDLNYPSAVDQALGVLIVYNSNHQQFFGGESAEMLRMWFTSQRSGVMNLDSLWQAVQNEQKRREVRP